ncbi:type II toxin-antitoxin system Phd/YefM family antitoxin [Prauserella alba]|uniref:Antitoxin n=1 Tax=Prauserella alba TaxID=176898 RepID=A0ABP4FV68_9PSEU|nr:type II toxin-antitoxin system prevent-host-death family antitoxin [Prauserella alba]MCP2181244.1 prevent-host-death family protein [Prauserella alba]
MSTEIRQSDLRNDNAAIMRRVSAGEAFVVTVNGRPVADVLPHQRDTTRRFVPVDEAARLLSHQTLDRAAWVADIAAVPFPDDVEDPWER